MILHALPFALAFAFLPLLAMGFFWGGAWIAASPVFGLIAIPLMDQIVGMNTDDMDLQTRDRLLFWHRLVTWFWVPVQSAILITLVYGAGNAAHLGGGEIIALAAAVGLVTGGIGITFAHELMHQRNRFERGLAEILMAQTLYGHFCIEHVYGHHIHVATPRDPASARLGENLYRFLPRCVIGTLRSAWEIQSSRLTRQGLPLYHHTNAFWRYGAYTLFFFAVSFAFGGWLGAAAFVVQAAVAVYLLESINYIEHYGLTRRLRDNGRYEPVRPYHSWNAAHRISNYLLINLQRHSDHHFHPDRRFPLLQNYGPDQAPQLPFSYSAMSLLAACPPLWHHVMDPRVAQWREHWQDSAAENQQ